MGRKPCCNKDEVRRGAWTSEEDKLLVQYITTHGEGKWRSLPLNAGLNRCGKSCRLRWFNYLKPDIKRGNITLEEEDLIIELHNKFGNRWALIAERLPGRTDNEIKNYWNTSLKRKILKNGSKLEISLKNKKSTGKKMAAVVDKTDIIKPGGSPSPRSEITSSDYSSPENETSSSSNVWERLLQELELESEDKEGDPMHIASGDAVSMKRTDNYQVTMEQPYQIKLETQIPNEPTHMDKKGDPMHIASGDAVSMIRTDDYQVTMEQPYQIKLETQIPNEPTHMDKKGDPMHIASGDAVSMIRTDDYQVTMEQPYQIKLETQIPNEPTHMEWMNSDDMQGDESSSPTISKGSIEWNIDEIWNNQADISCFSGKCDNDNDWANWLESFDVGSFSSILDEDLWGSVCV